MMPRLHDLSLAVRVVVTLVASGLLAVVLPGSLSVQTRALVVWNGAVLVFLGLIVAMCIGTTPDQVRDNARRVGHARARVLVGGLVTSLSSLLMVAVILSDMERHQPGFRTQINLCVAAVFSAWFLLQTLLRAVLCPAVLAARAGARRRGLRGRARLPQRACPRLLGFSLLLVHAGDVLRDLRRADSEPDAPARGPAAEHPVVHLPHHHHRAGHQRDRRGALAPGRCGPVRPTRPIPSTPSAGGRRYSVMASWTPTTNALPGALLPLGRMTYCRSGVTESQPETVIW